jgi:hypothetical protein
VELTFTRIKKFRLMKKVKVSSIFYLIYSYLPDIALPVQLEERAISPAISTSYTHNPLKAICIQIENYLNIQPKIQSSR